MILRPVQRINVWEVRLAEVAETATGFLAAFLVDDLRNLADIASGF
jgi:hypothetical protein